MENKDKKLYWIVSGLAAIVGVTFGTIYILNYNRRSAWKAKQFEGMKETANNSGFQDKAFQKMMEESGWHSGDQWCMFFAKMVWINTYKADEEKLKVLLNGSSQDSYRRAVADKGKTVIVTKEPKVGDIVIFQRFSGGVGSSSGHAGIVTKVNGKKSFQTIEGNTNEAGAAEGTIVLKKERSFNWNTKDGLRLKGFIRKVK
jgi:hypothetical protein